MKFAVTLIALALSGALALVAAVAPAPKAEKKGSNAVIEKVVKTEDEWKKILTPEQFHVLRKHGTERAFTSPLNDNHQKGVFVCAACGLTLFNSDPEIRLRHRLAELLGADRSHAHRHHGRPQLLPDPHRGPLRPLRRPPRPRLRGRPEADRPALLHERRVAEVRAREVTVPGPASKR